jgi:trigger factor
VQTQLEEVAENRVRLTVEVGREDVKHAVEHAASDLAGSLKIPGFRKGKVPLPVLLARVGKERLFAEAVESHIGSWFWSAAARTRIRPVARPEYDFELPSTDKEGWTFRATVDVQASPELADWRTLEVPRPEPEIPDGLVEHELDVLRGSVAELSPVEHRPATVGDTVVVDLVGTSGEAQRDYVVELGSGRLVPEIEEGIVGLSPGESTRVVFELSDDSSGEVEVTVKEIKEKVLPPLDDELARAASEFETLEELRADVETRLLEQIEDRLEGEFRANAADALVAASKVETAETLVEARTRELVNALVSSVERRGISFETYLSITGGSAEELVARLRAQARQSLARELVLEAVADQLELEVGDDEIKELVRAEAEGAGDDPEEATERFWEAGGHERLRGDLRLRKALDRVTAEVKPISVELAHARDKLWTPEKEKTPSDTKLWTPGSKEPA